MSAPVDVVWRIIAESLNAAKTKGCERKMELLFCFNLEEWNFVRRECFKIGKIPASNVVIIQRPLAPGGRGSHTSLYRHGQEPPPPPARYSRVPSLTQPITKAR